jgi:hypothetical protein
MTAGRKQGGSPEGQKFGSPRGNTCRCTPGLDAVLKVPLGKWRAPWGPEGNTATPADTVDQARLHRPYAVH